MTHGKTQFLLAVTLLTLAAVALPVRQAAAADCNKLKNTPFPNNTRITLVEQVTPNPVWIYPPSLFTTAAERLANGPTGAEKPFCRVVGIMEKEINFEVWLPRDWNGKFQAVGNGGLTGAINYPSMGAALSQGYATASTDTGHRTQQGFFEDEWLEGHPERLVNFAHRAHHLLAVTSKQIVKAYYAKPAARAYFSGCSSGGWEGLSEAQRYPDDYDGIVAGAPAIDLVQVQSRSILVAQMNLKNPQGALTHDLALQVAAAAVAKCDAKDGVKDGVIDDPRRCDFDPAELQCKTDSSKDCLTEAQVHTARSLYGPLKTAAGMSLYPGAAYGASPLAELPVSAKTEPGHAAITLMLPQKPSWDVHTFNPDRDIPALEQELGGTLDAANPDLHAFQAHGGKLIMYHGWADPLLSPYNTLDYYGAVVKAMGGQHPTDGFLRLFMVPGMEHCRGGPGPDTFDAVASLDNWVEHGAPRSGSSPLTRGRTARQPTVPGPCVVIRRWLDTRVRAAPMKPRASAARGCRQSGVCMNAQISPSRSEPLALVGSFLARTHALFIDGKFVPAQSGETFDVINPATGEVFAKAAAGGPADIDLAVKAARRAFEGGPWSSMNPSGRRNLMWKLADALERNAEEIATLESLDNGMPLTMARFMVAGAAECLRYNAGWAGKINGETPSIAAPNHHVYTLREPIGVVGAITPWNVPLAMEVAKVASALAAGCTVVLKPAELTPLTAIRLAELVAEAGFPPGVVNIVTGFGDPAGKALALHPEVDKISFTGSTVVGKSIVAASAGNLKRVALELGGKSPVIIFPDADLERATAGAADGIFRNAGQICVAGSRLYVHKNVFDQVVEGVVERARTLKVGSGMQPDTQMGPLISQKQLDRVCDYVQSGKEQGAEVVIGGKRAEGKGYFMQPTVLAETNREMRVVREEIFGPVVCAMPIDDEDLDRIVRMANDTEYGLSSNVWTRDISLAHKLARRIKAGTVRINGGVGLDYAMPFGGYKQSGWGRENAREGVEAYTEVKTVSVAL